MKRRKADSPGMLSSRRRILRMIIRNTRSQEVLRFARALRREVRAAEQRWLRLAQ